MIARLHRSLSHNKHYHIYDGAHLSAQPLNSASSATLLMNAPVADMAQDVVQLFLIAQ